MLNDKRIFVIIFSRTSHSSLSHVTHFIVFDIFHVVYISVAAFFSAQRDYIPNPGTLASQRRWMR